LDEVERDLKKREVKGRKGKWRLVVEEVKPHPGL
jgi:hypothetical protein